MGAGAERVIPLYTRAGLTQRFSDYVAMGRRRHDSQFYERGIFEHKLNFGIYRLAVGSERRQIGIFVFINFK